MALRPTTSATLVPLSLRARAEHTCYSSPMADPYISPGLGLRIWQMQKQAPLEVPFRAGACRRNVAYLQTVCCGHASLLGAALRVQFHLWKVAC